MSTIQHISGSHLNPITLEGMEREWCWVIGFQVEGMKKRQLWRAGGSAMGLYHNFSMEI